MTPDIIMQRKIDSSYTLLKC